MPSSKIVSEAIVSYFRSKDPDSTGLVSSKHVVNVFKRLDPVCWDDENIALLIDGFGKDADGKVKYVEFAVWVSGGKFDLVGSSAGTTRLAEVYDLDHQLGAGAFGTVRLATHRSSGAQRAIKTIQKSGDQAQGERLASEVAVMKELDHPNLVKVLEVYEDTQFLHLVMEICSGGELFDRIIAERRFTERGAAVVMRQVLSATCHMHAASICHRDLKPENLMLRDRDVQIDNSVIKITDFGLARRFTAGKPLTTIVGTPFYIAPEVLRGSYCESCDMWALGVIAYVLLGGYPPFKGRNDAEIFANIIEGYYEFHPPAWVTVTGDAKAFISKLLRVNPSTRCSASEALADVWIEGLAPTSEDEPLGADQISNIQDYCRQNRLKKAAMLVVAKRLGDSDIEHLRRIFESADVKKDGLVTYENLQMAVSSLGHEGVAANILSMAGELDVDGDGRIDYTEFLAAALEKRHYEEERVLLEAFQLFDHDGSGYLSRKELLQVLCNTEVETVWGSVVVAQVLEQCDGNADGQLDFKEFLSMMRS
mmetsp:Transcript_13688/g.36913  ORF Transcript_13688/g.36913 Transcript_13688/m.36913 type:complete len:537 (-) Transcript_13688:182-1792(-)